MLSRLAGLTRRFLKWVPAFVVMLVLHIPTQLGREAVRDIANVILHDQFLGELHIGEVTHIGWNGNLDATGIWLRDPEGQWIATGAHLVGYPVRQLIEGLRSKGPMPLVTLHVPRLWLRGLTYSIPAEASAPMSERGSLSIAATFRPRHPGPRSTSVSPPASSGLWFPRMDLTVDQIRSTVGGLVISGTNARAGTGTYTDPVQFWVGPIPRRTDASALAPLTIARAETDRAGPVRIEATFDYHSEYVSFPVRRYESNIDARAHVTAQGVDCTAIYHQQHDRIHAETSGCNASAGVIDRLTALPLRMGAALDHATFDRDSTGMMHLTATGSVNDQPATIVASGDTDNLDATLTTRHVDLARIRGDLPVTDLDGVVHVTRHGTEWMADTTGLHALLNGTVVPTVTAQASLLGHRLIVHQARADALGLTATGDIDLAAPLNDGWVEARVDTPDIHAYPIVGTPLHGALRATARLDIRPGVLHATYHADVRGLRAPGVHARSAEVGGSARVEHGTVQLDADVRASALTAGTFGPLDVHGRVHGDPRNVLDGDLHADASNVAALGPGGNTRLDSRFRARVTDHGVAVSIANSPLLLHGQNAHVAAEIEIPSGGTLSGHARLTTETGGSADVAMHGSTVSGRFQHFSMDWLGRALGTHLPFAGTLDGDLDLLTRRTGAAEGAFHWRNGRFPIIGEFDLDVSARRHADESEIDANLVFGSDRTTLPADRRHVIRATLRGVPPRDIADLEGWLRGTRQSRIDAHHIPLRIFESLLPRGARIGGEGELTATLSRREPEAPLESVIGWDIRNSQLSADAMDYLPAALQGLVHTNVSTRPLSEVARWRGAVCGRILRDDLSLVPVTIATTIARETGEPIVPPPTACEATDVQSHEPWLQVSGGLRGPWLTAITAAIHDVSAVALDQIGHALTRHTNELLHDAQAQLHIDVGPISTDRWPLTPTLGALVRVLSRPPIAGTARATLDLRGALYNPTVEADVTLHSSGIEQLASRDEVEAHAHLTLAPTTPGGSILDAVIVHGDANARLQARTARGLEEAGTATGTVILRDQLFQLFAPGQGLRTANFDRFEATTSRLQIGRLRWARSNNVEGLLTLTLRGTGDAVTPIAMNATLTDLQVRNQRAMAASVNAFVRNVDGDWEVAACTTMLESSVAPGVCDPDAPVGHAPRRGLEAGVTLPLVGDLLRFDPDIEGLRVSMSSQQFPLDTISPLVEVSPIVRVGGLLTSELSWTARAPRALSGEIHVTHGLLDLERVGVPAREIALDVNAEGRQALIQRLTLQLGTGSAEAHGQLDFHVSGNDVAALQIHATTTQLPATQEGNLYGYVSAEADYHGAIRLDGFSGGVDIQHAAISVPSQSSRDLQELDAHSDVFIMGETRLTIPQRTTPYPINIDFHTHSPVWVRRDDIEVAIHADGHIHYDPAGMALSGSVDQALRESWIDIFGKRFFFDRIGMEFDGSIPLNPMLDISAHFDSPTAGRLGLNVSGRYLAPQITFSSEQYPASTQSEILALLVLGRRESQSAPEQAEIAGRAQEAAGALLTGLLAGYGGTYARRQLDSLALPFVPRLIVEPGAGTDSSRYGLGATINSVPRLYIEGTYGTVTSYSGSTATDPSAQRPQDFHGLAEYTLTQHWSISANFGTSGRLGADVFYNFAP